MKLVTTREITVAECPWLDEDIPAGTELVSFYKYTYGCIGPNGRAVSLTGDYPFFEVPRNAIASM